MSSLRIALVSRRVHPAHGPGGLERHVHDQALHLARAGLTVDLYSETPADAARLVLARAAFPDGVRLHWSPGGPLPLGRTRGTVILDRISNYPLWARRVARQLPGGADLVHAHGLAGLGAAERAAADTLGAPLVLTTHGMEEFLSPSPLKRWLYAPFRRGMRRIAAHSARVVVTDEILVPVVRDALRVPADRLRVIPNAIDPEACEEAVDPSLIPQPSGTEPCFVSVGRLAANKGFTILARALGEAAPDLPERWRWILIGDGPERGAVEAAVREAGIESRVRLVGAVGEAEKHSLLAAADWFVHPTLYEGSSIATLEAMAHRLPVIASRAGGLPDKVRDGKTGLLVPPGDIAALAGALRRCVALDGPALGAAGRALLDAGFSWTAVTPRYLQLYAELVS